MAEDLRVCSWNFIKSEGKTTRYIYFWTFSFLIAKWCNEFGGLHLNPGAAGLYGNHAVRTLMRFDLSDKGIENLEIVEINRGIRLQ